MLMRLSLTNSNDVVANSISLIEGDAINNISDIFLTKDEAGDIVGIPPETLNTLEKIADAIGGDENFFTTIEGKLANKQSTLFNRGGTGVELLMNDTIRRIFATDGIDITLFSNDADPLDPQNSNIKISGLPMQNLMNSLVNGLLEFITANDEDIADLNAAADANEQNITTNTLEIADLKANKQGSLTNLPGTGIELLENNTIRRIFGEDGVDVAIFSDLNDPTNPKNFNKSKRECLAKLNKHLDK